MATGMARISRSSTSAVASGVTSTGGKPCAAGGQDEIDPFLVGAGAERRADLPALVRHNGRVNDGEARVLQHGADGGAAGVLPNAPGCQGR